MTILKGGVGESNGKNGRIQGFFHFASLSVRMTTKNKQRRQQIPFGNDNQKAEQRLGVELLEEVAEGVASVADVPFLVAGDFGEGLVE